MSAQLLQLIILTSIIHLIDTLAYAVRLNSVRGGQFALSTSLFNVFVLVSRTANTLQGPLIGGLVGTSISLSINPLPQVRMVIFASSIGTIMGILLIPTFLKVFAKAVEKVEASGSVPALLVQGLSISNIKRIAQRTTLPQKSMLNNIRYSEIPKRLLLLNTLITGIYTIGVLSAFYAATMVPADLRLAASASSGLINGIASIMLTLFIDPYSAIVTDQVLRGSKPYENVKTLVVLLISTKLFGTLLGQALIVPAAEIIASFYK